MLPRSGMCLWRQAFNADRSETDMDGLRRNQILLDEILELLKEPTKRRRSAAIKKLDDVTMISSTLSLTLRVRR